MNMEIVTSQCALLINTTYLAIVDKKLRKSGGNIKYNTYSDYWFMFRRHASKSVISVD